MSLALIPPALLYGLMNIVSATGIVFANKTTFSIYNFEFPYALTFIHTIVTYLGMQSFLRWGVFEGRRDILTKGEGVKVRDMTFVLKAAVESAPSPVSFDELVGAGQ